MPWKIGDTDREGEKRKTKAAEKRRTPKRAHFGVRRFPAAFVSCVFDAGLATEWTKQPKVDAVEDRRVRLIEQLCRLPEAQLCDVEALLVHLERDSVGTPPPQMGDGPSRISLPAHKDWPHAPVHRLSEHGTFIVTASTLQQHHYFRGEESLTMLENKLLELAKQHEIVLEAWAVFSNHYHFVAHTTGAQNQLADLIARLHFTTAEEVNRRDQQPGREVWFNFWDTQLTYERSYLARLNYVHQNAVKHRLVRQANEYRWCSAAWFERTATQAQVKTIYLFKTDRVKIDDDYEPVV